MRWRSHLRTGLAGFGRRSAWPLAAKPTHKGCSRPRRPCSRSLLIHTAHAGWGLDAPVAVFAAQVHQESAWRPDAVSHVGAQGLLAQFMPATSRWIATQAPELAAPRPYNPAWALRALVYDRWLYQRTPTRYTPYERMWVALPYNGGLGHWQQEAASTGAVASLLAPRWTRPAAQPAAQPCIAKKTWATPTASWCCSPATCNGGQAYEHATAALAGLVLAVGTGLAGYGYGIDQGKALKRAARMPTP